MSNRRILSIWFPRLGAERLIRQVPTLWDVPLAVVAEQGNMQTVASLNRAAAQAGVRVGQPVRDAHAVCAGLITKAQDTSAEAAFLTVLRRWAGKFSPWVAEEQPDGLVIDLTGCAHLFGGEEALAAQIDLDCADLGLTVRIGVADTLGAAWALARFAGQTGASDRSGDAIDMEARATRSRAVKRRNWERGGAAPHQAKGQGQGQAARIAAPAQTYGALSPLPVAALRLDADMVAQLNRLGLRKIGDLLGQPRAALARRFGKGLVLRMDQAMGSAPEPVSPAKPPHHFAVRMTLPDPIGLIEDIQAGIDRLLPRLCQSLSDKSRALRSLRLQAFRTDHAIQSIEIGLAQPTTDPARIAPLLALKLDRIEAGFGIDMLRVEALVTEPVQTRNAVGHLDAANAVQSRLAADTALDDLIGRLGARVGLDAITRLHPADSHIPEKTSKVMAAAWSEPAQDWPKPSAARPMLIWTPEPVHVPALPHLPAKLRWRGQTYDLATATGPERIAPEWWLDTPDWRTGVRDYWVVTTACGQRLWMYFAYGAAMSAGWFCQGRFS